MEKKNTSEHTRYHTCSYSFLLTLRLPNRKDPHPTTYESINAIDIPPN